MGQSVTLHGSQILVYMNNRQYPGVQSISLEFDYSEEGIYGIDVPYPQEIAGGKTTVRGSIKGLRIRNNGGLQGFNLRPLFTDLMASPYVSIRIQDRTTGEDIVLLLKAKITNESHSITVKGTYKLNFDFIGQIPLFSLDRAD